MLRGSREGGTVEKRAWMTIGAGVVLSALLLGVSGCTDPGAAESPAVAPVAAAEATPSPIPTPVVPAYVADQNAVALAASVHGMVASLDGFASPESKAGLEDAVTRLDLDLAAADASVGVAATATSTPGASPGAGATTGAGDRVLPPGGWNQLVALDSSTVLQALDAARVHVIATSSRVLNAETPNAEQGVRDTLYLAVVEQQNTPAATADTARLVGELVAKSRAAQVSQQAWVDEQARLAAQPSGGGSSDGGGGGGETGTGSITFTWVDGWDAAKKELEDSVQANIDKWRAEHPLCMADGQGCTPN